MERIETIEIDEAGVWSEEVEGVEALTLRSAESGREYVIGVALPPDVDHERKLPVLIVTDGDWHLAKAIRVTRSLTAGGHLEPLVVVGVGYPTGTDELSHRSRDLTPSLGRPLTDEEAEWSNDTGGAAPFCRMLSDELIPSLAGRYRIDADRIALFGHSLGGLLAVLALAERGHPFSAGFIVSAPSTWWGDGVALELPDEVDATSLVLSVGELETSKMLACADETWTAVAKRPDIKLWGHSIAGETHQTAELGALSIGCRILFDSDHQAQLRASATVWSKEK